MNTTQYIINDIKPFDVTTALKEIQNAFNQLTYSHIPVMDDELYLGCISETDAHCFDSEKPIQEYKYALEAFHVTQKTNWLDILEAFALQGANIMPVLDEKQQYMGYYELSDIMALFNDTPFLNEAGGIIVVEKGTHDYSFSEICQIIESNDGKVLGAFISKIENDVTQATIKIGHSGMNAIAQTFRRYGYNVISEHAEDMMQEELRLRSKYLDKYLNM